MKKIVFVIGPTASGKTEYALRLAEILNGEIISADSMQIYKYMDIGSAKPTVEERQRIKHYLVDEIDPGENFSVAEYKNLAGKYIDAIIQKRKLPIICGGTGLYINALVYDLDFSASPGDIQKRKILEAEIGQGNPQKLHAHLSKLDPQAAKTIHPNNIKRILRAIERLESGSEKNLTAFADCKRPTTAFTPIMIGLHRERSALYERIDRRVDQLMKEGLVAEVVALMEKGFTENDVAMKGIGYKEIILCIKNGQAGEMASDEIKKNTRRYAKRQITWFKQYVDIHCNWFALKKDEFEDDVLNSMVKYIKSV